MCICVACMSKHVSSTVYAMYYFLLDECVCIPQFKEIQGFKVKTTMNVLKLLNLDEEKALILWNYHVFPKQNIVNLCALVLGVCLNMYLPQRMHCTVFYPKNMCE